MEEPALIKKLYLMLFVFLLVFEVGGCANKENKIEQSVESEEITKNITSSSPKVAIVDNHYKKGNKKAKKEEIESDSKKKIEKRAKKAVSDDTMVDVENYISDIVVDLKYATKDNFTGKKIYDFKKAYLRYGTVKKLKKAQDALRKKELYLNIWDAYRPVKAQFRLWEACSDSTYVANPNTGFSSHNRGNTVDVTLVTANWKKVNMPTGFDDFTKKADRDFSDCTREEAKNAELLEEAMESSGFKGYSKEWWHFSDTISYSVKKEVKNLK